VWGGGWGKPQVKTRFLDNVHVQRCAVSDQKSYLLLLGTRTKTTILTTETNIRIVLEGMWFARPKEGCKAIRFEGKESTHG
jgi:hypothetical protein